MNLKTYLSKLKNTPTEIEFSDTMSVIETLYTFTPTVFKNGELNNNKGENSGSCKLLAFAAVQGFTKEEALACFGKFYTDDVLKDPHGTGHQNIRNFMKNGFEGLVFKDFPLEEK